MSIADHNEGEISPAVRERIDEFSRELALALKRILSETEEKKDIDLPDGIEANPVSEDEEKATK